MQRLDLMLYGEGRIIVVQLSGLSALPLHKAAQLLPVEHLLLFRERKVVCQDKKSIFL